MRSLAWTLGLMLVANAAFAQFPGSQPSGAGFAPPPIAASPSRIGLMFQYQAAPGAGDFQLRYGAVDVGLEYSTPVGAAARYHASLLYSNCGCGSNADYASASGLKVAPLGFGWGLPVYRMGPLRVEVEGVISFIEFQLLSAPQAASDPIYIYSLSTGLYGQATLS
jgi:hypothetical protein